MLQRRQPLDGAGVRRAADTRKGHVVSRAQNPWPFAAASHFVDRLRRHRVEIEHAVVVRDEARSADPIGDVYGFGGEKFPGMPPLRSSALRPLTGNKAMSGKSGATSSTSPSKGTQSPECHSVPAALRIA